MENKKLRTTLYLTLLGVISFVLMYLMEIPILPAAPYLKYDLSEVVAIVGGFLFGPLAGSAVILIKSLLFFLSGKGASGWVGLLASALSGFALVWGTVLLYRIKKTNLMMYLGIPLGVLLITASMTLFNYFILLPLYGIPAEEVGSTLTAAIIPFNLIKGAISTVLSIGIFGLLHKRMESFLKR